MSGYSVDGAPQFSVGVGHSGFSKQEARETRNRIMSSIFSVVKVTACKVFNMKNQWKIKNII